MKTLNIITILFLLITVFSCDKNKTKERRLGDDTLSFYLNGELWQNSSSKGGGGMFGSADGCSIHYNNYHNSIEINAYTNDEHEVDVSLEIILSDIKGINPFHHTFKENNLDHESFYHNYSFSFIKLRKIISYKNVDNYQTKEGSGFIEFTKFNIDTNKISGEIISDIEGHFEATLFNINNPKDIIEITDGRFNN